VNNCIFIGNFVRDPELQSVGAEHRVAKFAIAVNGGRKNRNGEEEVAFIECEAWDKSADTISKYMKKGSKIAIQATARTDTWTDKSSGTKRSTLRFRVNNFTFLGAKNTEARSDKAVAAGVGAEDEGVGFASGADGEEIPF
jgi:single-strand DNA-binding protein